MGIIFGFVFFLIFYIHRIIGRRYYFGFGELIYGYRTSISIMAFVFRAFLILVFGFVVAWIFSNPFVPCFSAFFGALLVIWPAILNPYETEFGYTKKKVLVVIAYIGFIIASVTIAWLGFMIFAYVKPAVWDALKDIFGESKWIVFLIGAILSIVLESFIRVVFRVVNKERTIPNPTDETNEK
jgi:hypothetical protein